MCLQRVQLEYTITLSRELSGTFTSTHKKRFRTSEMFHRDKFRIATVEVYTTQCLRKAEPCDCADNHIHRSVGHCGSAIDTWIPMGGKRVRDIRVLRSNRGSRSANSYDAERGEEGF